MAAQTIALLVTLVVAIAVMVALQRFGDRLSAWARIVLALQGGALAGAVWAILSRRLHDLPWSVTMGAVVLVGIALIQDHLVNRR